MNPVNIKISVGYICRQKCHNVDYGKSNDITMISK